MISVKERVSGFVLAVALAASADLFAADAMRTAELGNVRLGGAPGAKLDAFVAARVTSPFAQREIFGEARRAFEERDDDPRPGGGLWRGEFWGKLMLGTARVADYLRDPQLTAFVRAECRRLMALQDADGYLGSYADKERVAITNQALARANYGWPCLWNLWNRKYAMWGMFMAYRATGDREILASVERQMNQLIDMMRRLGVRLQETGATQMNGMPSMSLLKPLVLLYGETGNRKYLDYAAEMLPDWDRADAPPPNFFRNAFGGKPLADWYANPQVWAKAYEMMSCLDGLLEYYRATGERRCLDAVVAIRDGLARDEANPFQAVGYGDKFFYAPQRANALNEVCDVIHWIRLNLDLYLITGEKRFLDAIEPAYVNGFLAGIYRDGQWGPFFLRGHGRHQFQRQCGYAYNHCCVNNLPRTFMDIASAVVTADAKGVYHVNFYEDATVEMDGVRFAIAGNYPVGDRVTVTVSKKVPLAFHRPSWCPKMDVREEGLVTTLRFDMNPRIVDRVLPNRADDAPKDGLWAYNRYGDKMWKGYNRDVLDSYRTTAAAQVMWGPLVLAKARRIGDTEAEVFDPFTVNRKGYAVRLAPRAPTCTWGLWDVELTKPGEPTVRVKACDFQSAGDTPIEDKGMEFSIWF